MTLSRSLSKFIISTPNPNKWPLLRSFSSPFSTKTVTKLTKTTNPNQSSTSDFPKPSEIPFQSKVANSVHLVGTIGEPVKIQTLAAGDFAVSVLVQKSKKKDGPKLCIPVIFQGDLAHIAACHLKEKDLVYVTGQLSGDPVPVTAEDKSKETVRGVQNHLQILAISLSFVKKTSSGRESEMVYDQDDAASDCSEDANGPNRNAKSLWSDLVDSPQEWRDIREDKLNKKVSSKYPDFKRSTGEVLWLNSAPDWVLSKLDGLVFCGINDTAKSYGKKRNITTKSSTGKSDGLASEDANGPNRNAKSLWSDLVDNPQEWRDIREDKLNKKVSSKYPDFKRSTGEVLWLNREPDWVLSKLDGLVFCGINDTAKSYGTKRNNATKSSTGKSDGLASEDANGPNRNAKSLWSDLVDNPQEWRDIREDKLNKKVSSKYPDFKRSTGEVLWLNSAPDWVLSKLDGLAFCGINDTAKSYGTKRNNTTKSSTGKSDGLALHGRNNTAKCSKEDLWKNLVENPKNWWDNRSDKLKPRSPDFKHKDTGEGLWLGRSTPSWAFPRLPPAAPKQVVKADTLLS